MSALILTYNESPIHIRDEMLCLTDMWSAAGRPDNREPYQWARKEGSPFISAIAEMHNLPVGQVLKAKQGRGGGSWGHWQIGFAYAKYLSPEFHAWCNTAAREKLEGVARHQVSVADIEQRVMAAVGGMLKGIVVKQVGTRLAEIEARIETTLASYDPSSGFSTDYKPMLAYIEKMGVPPKARRSLVSAASRRCHTWLFQAGRHDMVRPSRETGRHLFHVSAVPDWMRAEGRQMVRDHMDRLIGQTAMALATKQKEASAAAPFVQAPEPVS